MDTTVQPPVDEDNGFVMDALEDAHPDGGSTEEIKPVAPAPETVMPQPEMVDADAGETGEMGKTVADMGKGLLAGAEAAVSGVRQGARAIAKTVLPDSMQDAALDAPLTNIAPQPESMAGKVVADLSNLAVSYFTGSKVLKAGAGVTAKSATGTLLTSDPNRERISNILAENEWLEPVFGMLAQDPTDSVLVSKAKAAIEDVASSHVANALFTSLKFIALKVTGKGTPAQVAAAEKEVIAAQKAADQEVITLPEVKVTAEAEKSAGRVAEPVADVGATPSQLTLKIGDNDVTLTGKEAIEVQEAFKKLVREDLNIGGPAKPAGGAENARPNPDYLAGDNTTLQSLEIIGQHAKKYSAQLTPEFRSANDTRILAETMGKDPDELMGRLHAMAEDTKDVDAISLGGRMVVQNLGHDAFLAARKAVIEGGIENHTDMVEKWLKQMTVQADIDAIGTNLGRGLRAHQEIAAPFDPAEMRKIMADPKKVDHIAKLLVASEGDPEKLARITEFARMSWGQKLLGMHNEYWMGGALLSRMSSLTYNAAATAFNLLMEPAAMTTGAALRLDWKTMREGMAIYNGMRTQIFDSFEMGRRTFMTGEAQLSQAGTMEVKTKYISSLAFNLDPEQFMGRFVDLMGETVRFSFRSLTATDEFMKNVAYRGRVSASASREALDLVKAGQLEKKDIKAFIEDKLQKSIDQKNGATNEAALHYAEKAAFVNDLKGNTWFGVDSIGELTARFAGHPVLRGTILPFVKTPVNVMRTTFEYTPVIGQMRKQFYADLAEGGEKGSIALGKLTIGAGLYSGAVMLAMEGRITGAPPGPGVMTPPGWKPYSVVFTNDDGTKRYVSYQKMQPFGDILGLTADFTQITGFLDEYQREGIASAMVLGLTKFMDGDALMSGVVAGSNSLINKNYLRSLTEFMSMFGGYNSESKAEHWWQQKVSSYVPGAVAQFNYDETIREVRSTLDAIMARIPGLSESLPPKRDYFGDIQQPRIGFPYSVIVPINARDGKADPLAEELVRLSASNGKVKFNEPQHLHVLQGRDIDLKKVKNEQGVTAYDRMVELMQTVTPRNGASIPFREALQNVVDSSRYEKGVDNPTLDGTPMYPGLRTTLIKEQEEKYRKAAFEQMIDEFRGPLGLGDASVMSIVNNEKVNRTKAKRGIENLFQ